MEKKAQGAWIVHHAKKLENVSGTREFDEIATAGKCGMLLSAFAESETVAHPTEKVKAIAKGVGISKLELPSILNILSEQKLVFVEKDQVTALAQ